MNMDTRELIVGALAGAAIIVMWASLNVLSLLGILLFFLSPLPVMVAALGWGVTAGAVGVVTGAIGLALVAHTQAAIFITLTITLPGAMAAWWLSLARPATEIGGPAGKLAWYPLSDVIFRLALMMALAFIVTGALIQYGEDYVRQAVALWIEQVQLMNPEFAFSPEAEEQFVSQVFWMIPLTQPALWLFILVLNIYLALALVRRSGRLRRPRDHWPVSLRMPRASVIVLAVAMALTFFSGSVALVGATVVGALFGGFTLAGFAVFHDRTSGQPWQLPALIVVYVSSVLTMFPALIFTVIGMFNLARNMPVSNSPGGSQPPPPLPPSQSQ